MQSLISARLVESDGSLRVKKKVKYGTAVKVEEHGLGVNKNTTYAQRVNGEPPSMANNALHSIRY